MVEILTDARKLYHRDNPDGADLLGSRAVFAADRWLDFLRVTRRSNANSQASSPEAHGLARAFPKEVKRENG